MYDSLATTSAVHVRLNNWVLLSTSLADAWAQQYAAHSRPYHTLLLLDEPETLLAQLSPDASPQVRQLIKLASPLKSFQDMQVPRVASCASVVADVGRSRAHLSALLRCSYPPPRPRDGDSWRWRGGARSQRRWRVASHSTRFCVWRRTCCTGSGRKS